MGRVNRGEGKGVVMVVGPQASLLAGCGRVLQ